MLRVLDVEGQVDRLRLPRWVVLGKGSEVENGVIAGNLMFVGPLHLVSFDLLISFLDSQFGMGTDQ